MYGNCMWLMVWETFNKPLITIKAWNNFIIFHNFLCLCNRSSNTFFGIFSPHCNYCWNDDFIQVDSLRKKSSLNESDKMISMFETKFLSREQKLESILFLMFLTAALSFLKCITCSYLCLSTIMLHNSFLSFSFPSQVSWEKTVNSMQWLLNSSRTT